MPFLATINVPGYLPESEALEFDTAQAAWRYLAEERERDEDDQSEDSEYGDTWHDLRILGGEGEAQDIAAVMSKHGINFIGTGCVYALTPGGRAYDLGLAYSVMKTN